MTRVLLIGDVGVSDGRFHVGDEAMFAAAVEELSARGVEHFLATSAEPADTSARYGVDAVGRLDFSAARTPRLVDREDRLERIIRAAEGETGLLDWKDPAWAVIEAVAAVDAVLICGGGNLSSTWPEHVYERVAVSRLSAAFSTPLVISGQTLGPALTLRDGELVSELLESAVLVGVREARSFALARALGDFPHVVRTLDDAAFLAPPVDAAAVGPEPGTYCLATFAPHTGSAPADDFVRRVAQFLDDIVALTDLDVALLAHEGSFGADAADGDRAVHLRIADAMTSDRVIDLGVPEPAVAAELARNAALSVSTRYHSAVFALAGAVPAITFCTDEYTDAKLAGALENVGFAEGALSIIALATDDARDTVATIWEKREAIREHLSGTLATRRVDAASWWDAVAAAANGAPAVTPTWSTVPETTALRSRLRERNARLRAWISDEGRARIGAEIARRGASEEHAARHAELLSTERALGEARAETETALQRAAEAEAARDATQALLAEMAEPLFERTLRSHPTVVTADELEALLNSKTFRWTSKPRAAYGRARRWFGR